MPKYRATLQVTGLTGENPRAARAALDEELRKRGIENCRIVGIDLEPLPPKKAKPPKLDRAAIPKVPAPPQANAGGLLLVAATAWALWFFWWMLSASPE